MKTPTIDVIIPFYNTEKYIIEAIKSVENQTVLPSRVIVVDDGSTDGGVALLEAHNSKIPITIIRKANGGVSSARNAGILLSQADYIALLDADDRYLPNKLENDLKVLQESDFDKIAIVYSSYEMIDSEGRRLENYPVEAINERVRGNIRDYLFTLRGFPCTVLILRSVFEHVGLFDTQLAGGEDHDMWMRVSELYNIDYTMEVGTQIRLHQTNSQKHVDKMIHSRFLFFNKWVPKVNDLRVLKQWSFSLVSQLQVLMKHKNYLVEAKKSLEPAVWSKLFDGRIGPIKFRSGRYLIHSIKSIIILMPQILKYAVKRVFKGA